jgi:hypothetical protein
VTKRQAVDSQAYTLALANQNRAETIQI